MGTYESFCQIQDESGINLAHFLNKDSGLFRFGYAKLTIKVERQ